MLSTKNKADNKNIWLEHSQIWIMDDVLCAREDLQIREAFNFDQARPTCK